MATSDRFCQCGAQAGYPHRPGCPYPEYRNGDEIEAAWTAARAKLARPRFALGRTVATPGALDALEYAEVLPAALLARHQAGDWGDLEPEDKAANEAALKDGSRIFSAYILPSSGVKVWVTRRPTGRARVFYCPMSIDPAGIAAICLVAVAAAWAWLSSRPRPHPEPPAVCAWCRWRDGSECTHPDSPARGRLLVDVCAGRVRCEVREPRP